jgi:hypothetical protein
LCSWVIGANMEGKLFVALQLEVLHHFIEGFIRGRSRRLKPPGAYKLAGHPPIKVSL